MKVLIDMNLSPNWTGELSSFGEIVHWSTIGAAGAPDSEIFAYARQHGFCVFTNDLDFGAILASSHLDGPSVFQIRSLVLDPKMIGPAVLDCLRAVEADLLKGALISYDLSRARIRKLPIA